MRGKLFVLLLISIANGIAQETSPQHTTVVEGNHFYSNYEINTTYNIAQVSTDRSIIFILRKKDDNQIFDNNITITLISGEKSVQCRFVSFNGMCYLQQLPTPNMIMKLKCDHLPCEASWTILQPSVKKLQQTQAIQEMYDISGEINHMIAMVSCNNPQITNFDQLVTTYSQRQYVRGSTNNVIYLLFKKQKSGHLFFKIQPKAKACAQMAIYNVKQELKEDEEAKDFVFANQSSIYTFGSKPPTQFQIDCSFHEITKQAIKSDLIMKLTGEKNGIRQTIISSTIKPSIPTTDYEFSWAIPAISGDYSNLQVDVKSSNNILIFNYMLSIGESIQIQESQHAHFKLNKGQKLKFRLINQPQADSSDQVYFYISKPAQLKLSTKQCSKKQGCEFQIEALADSDAVLYAGKSSTGDAKGQITFFDFKDKFTKKIKDGQTIYLKTPLKKDEVLQVVINNPNVIVRAAAEEQCKIPSSQCYEHIANSHHHFIYEPKNDGNLLFAVTGLDNCQFTLSVLKAGTESIQLKDGEPFIYFMDDREKRIFFRFTLPEKTGVSFNLIAPLNDLLLIVNNGKQKPNGDEHTASTDGYISFSKEELQSNQFRILVEKTPDAKHKSVHFTLIATTSGANLRLDPGIAHIQTFKPKQFKDFVFQFDRKGDYIINFYVPTNVNKNEIQLRIMANNEDKWTDNKVKHMSITQNSDVLNLRDVSEELCIEAGDVQCQIFLRLTNAMKIQVDVTITLLVKDSVIELKDGLWQTYAINTIAKTSHFYFLPQNKNSSINIMYKSSLVDVGISYTIWKSDKQDIDPTQWPFPAYKQNVQDQFSVYKSVNHVIIDTQNLKGCWPSCVILISLYKKKGGALNFFSTINPNIQGNFSIMAANKVLEIPQKTKIEIMLKQNQEKYLMVDLKYYQHKEALTFFINEILGSSSLFGNVYSEKNPRCPTADEHDFNFGQIQTQIKMSSIEQKISQNDMSDDKDTFLCLLANAYLESKFTIQFTSQEQIIKLLHYDTFQKFQLQPRASKFFQLQAEQQYEIKFTREKGYFYVKISVCGSDRDYEQCLQQLKQSKDKGKQIITKTQQFSQKPCQKCIVFIRVESDDYCQAIIHVQSQYSMVELKQSDIISDFTNEGEVNKYSITSVQKQETIINVEVTEGEPVITVFGYGDVNITKEKDPKTNNIMIVLPPKKTAENTITPLGGVLYDAYAYSSTFRYLIVEVKSKNPKLSTAYTITYSSGEREVYMQDGMAVGYTLEANKKASFLYENPSEASHGYITLSMPKSSTLYNLKFKMFTFSDPDDEDTKTEVTPEKPPMRKHTPNPTIVYALPKSKLVKMELQSETETKVTLMINHQELIILPFNQEFPFQLHKGQTINLITDVNNPGYLLVSIRKCDQSAPDFGYTFDYQSFQKSEFEYTTSLAEDPKFQFYIKASKIGTLYMQMNSTDDNGLFSISARYSDSKIKGDKIKPGKNGKLQYQITDSNKAQISFSPITCSSGSKCDKDVKYYWMASNNLQDVYTQTVCPYSYFQTLGISSSQPIKINQVSFGPGANGIISFNYEFKEHITYITVKAVVGTQEVYYQPMEVITLWGSVTRSSKANKFYLALSFALVCLGSLVVYRKLTKSKNQVGNKKNRKGYQVLDDEPFDH